ncbi:MAG: DUF2336 domain-containing protein [Alphaproteobacteria bacterium]|nr:DUF2336 domain-containing protein [Alphaproteobacteria bacterium]
MAEILWRAIHDLETDLREELAGKLWKLDARAQGIANLLADSNLEISRQALQQHEVVRNQSLVEAAKYRAFEFLVSQAQQTGDDPSAAGRMRNDAGDRVEELLADDDAILVLRTRAYLVERATRVDRFQRPVLVRAELATGPTQTLLWWTAAAVRLHILAQPDTRQEIDAGRLDDLMEDAARAIGRRVAAETGRDCAVDALAARLADAGELSLDFLLEVLEQGHTGLFVAGLAQLCRLERIAAQRVVFDETGEPLALACRAAGFSREDFETIYQYTRLPQHRARGPAIMRELAKLYQTVSPKTALRSLAFWNRSSEYLSALDRLRN